MLTIGGNPYHPSSCYPYLNFDTPLEDAYKTFGYAAGEGNTVRATLCGRGQATQDSYAHADRITTPLKRAGKRGEGKWQAIGWDQLIEEVVEGGKLFADLGEDQEVVGFRGLHDTATPMDPTQPKRSREPQKSSRSRPTRSPAFSARTSRPPKRCVRPDSNRMRSPASRSARSRRSLSRMR